MSAQRVGITALRRVTASPSAFFTQNLAKSIIASSISTSQTRTLTTERLTPDDAHTILSQQRLKRPVSPHLDIYDKKQTYFGGSIWQRFTGVGFSGLLYGYAIAYLVAPLTGLHLESASMVAAFGSLPVAVKGGLKFLVAWPFVFHAMNGVRHAAYDMAWGFKKTTVIRSGWYIWGASIVGALACLML
jgi:succinate dehydrogenase (ubiquinone) cytochrome b560 subunit